MNFHHYIINNAFYFCVFKIIFSVKKMKLKNNLMKHFYFFIVYFRGAFSIVRRCEMMGYLKFAKCTEHFRTNV